MKKSGAKHGTAPERQRGDPSPSPSVCSRRQTDPTATSPTTPPLSALPRFPASGCSKVFPSRSPAAQVENPRQSSPGTFDLPFVCKWIRERDTPGGCHSHPGPQGWQEGQASLPRTGRTRDATGQQPLRTPKTSLKARGAFPRGRGAATPSADPQPSAEPRGRQERQETSHP